MGARLTKDGLRMEPARGARTTAAARAKKSRCYKGGMIDSSAAVPGLNDDDLVARTREIASRKILRGGASPSMIRFCMREFIFSGGAAYNRSGGARAGGKIPAILD